MSYQVLSRKWRPKNFNEVIGQEHVTTSLLNSLKRGRTGHAYLFTGTRGVGKTSVARIFAKSLRCENLGEDGRPCDKCPSCLDFTNAQSLDVIEIDGASNNSVDNIRELINNVQFLPSTGKFRVYIIDEVHMLSTSAFNALLKTLEEPPEHVIFIFATTEPQKILDTVLSRCQRFDFRSPGVETLSAHIKRIAENEGITFENESIVSKISFFGNGSVRDSLSILDQLLTFSENNNIDENTLFLGLGLAKQSSLYELANKILEGDINGMSSLYRTLQTENISSEKIYHGLIDTFYEIINSLMGGESEYPHSLEGYGPQELMWIYETLARDLEWAQKTFDLGKTLEVILHKITVRRTAVTDQPVIQKKKVKSVEPKVTKPKAAEVKKPEPKPIPKPKQKNWEGFLEHLHSISPATGHNLEQGNIVKEPTLSAGVLSVVLGFPQSSKVFYEYISQGEVKKKIEQELSKFYEVELTGVNLELDLKGVEEKFNSVANIKDNKIKEDIAEREKNLLDNPNLKMAESLFNSKVDKVIVTKKQ